MLTQSRSDPGFHIVLYYPTHAPVGSVPYLRHGINMARMFGLAVNMPAFIMTHLVHVRCTLADDRFV
jgi:hypothetical protein